MKRLFFILCAIAMAGAGCVSGVSVDKAIEVCKNVSEGDGYHYDSVTRSFVTGGNVSKADCIDAVMRGENPYSTK